MPALGAIFAVSPPACGLMSKIATLQPSSARRSVSPRPIPCPPPVTMATLPDRPFNSCLPVSFVVLAVQSEAPCFGSRGHLVLLERKSMLRIHLSSDDSLHDLD